MKRCIKVRVLGKVQDVGYRHYVQKHAEKLALEGRVQNNEDGSVAILVCGPSEKIDDLIDVVYQGSSKAKIEDVIIEPVQIETDFRGIFRVIGDSH